MNILYISNLTGNLFAGPNHSVPAQIKAQSKIDCVMWYNLNYVKREEWVENGLNCKNLSDYPSGRLKDLPQPFCNPDIAIIEEFYCYPFSKIISDLDKENIPYVIIPRSELTEQAQKKKAWKKRIGNLLYFKKLAKKAVAIQYLSKQEYVESGNKWNKKTLIIPNGTKIEKDYKQEFSYDKIKAVYIGRYEQYQKGLDILLEAISKTKDILSKIGFELNMYGVDQEDAISKMNQKIKQYKIESLININDAVYGDTKKQILRQSDIFIMTSRFEGMPMGMIEALSFGLPCVATTGTNLTFEIEKYNAGWIAENTADSVGLALIKMVEEYGDVKIKGCNARKLATTFSWETIAKKSHKEYVEILGGVYNE